MTDKPILPRLPNLSDGDLAAELDSLERLISPQLAEELLWLSTRLIHLRHELALRRKEQSS